jgi:hypothetical protein
MCASVRHLVNILLFWYWYLLTPWSRVLLEKLTGFAARQEIPRIYATRKFITVPTSARHLFLSWARSIQSPQPLFTYLLTPWSRVLLEKLTGFAASQEIPRIYGTRKFITVLTSARNKEEEYWQKLFSGPKWRVPSTHQFLVQLRSLSEILVVISCADITYFNRNKDVESKGKFHICP